MLWTQLKLTLLSRGQLSLACFEDCKNSVKLKLLLCINIYIYLFHSHRYNALPSLAVSFFGKESIYLQHVLCRCTCIELSVAVIGYFL